MKKIKLLAPILGLGLSLSTIAPMASCKTNNNGEITPNILTYDNITTKCSKIELNKEFTITCTPTNGYMINKVIIVVGGHNLVEDKDYTIDYINSIVTVNASAVTSRDITIMINATEGVTIITEEEFAEEYTKATDNFQKALENGNVFACANFSAEHNTYKGYELTEDIEITYETRTSRKGEEYLACLAAVGGSTGSGDEEIWGGQAFDDLKDEAEELATELSIDELTYSNVGNDLAVYGVNEDENSEMYLQYNQNSYLVSKFVMKKGEVTTDIQIAWAAPIEKVMTADQWMEKYVDNYRSNYQKSINYLTVTFAKDDIFEGKTMGSSKIISTSSIMKDGSKCFTIESEDEPTREISIGCIPPQTVEAWLKNFETQFNVVYSNVSNNLGFDCFDKDNKLIISFVFDENSFIKTWYDAEQNIDLNLTYTNATPVTPVADDGLEYNFSEEFNGAIVYLKKDSKLTDIVIPSTCMIDGEEYPVTAIGLSAFAKSDIESVVIPSSVVFIGADAFNSCQKLSKVELGDYTTRWFYGEDNEDYTTPEYMDEDEIIEWLVNDNTPKYKEIVYSMVFNKDEYYSIPSYDPETAITDSGFHYQCSISLQPGDVVPLALLFATDSELEPLYEAFSKTGPSVYAEFSDEDSLENPVALEEIEWKMDSQTILIADGDQINEILDLLKANGCTSPYVSKITFNYRLSDEATFDGAQPVSIDKM